MKSTDSNTRERLHALDALRGLAAMGVAFFWHYTHFNFAFFLAHPDHMPFYRQFHWLYSYAWNFVDFFFVLSGFIFMRTYTHRIMAGQITFRTYAINRISRLYPLHLLTLIIVTLQLLWMHAHGKTLIYTDNDFLHFVFNLFMVQAAWFDMTQTFNGPSWSIATEIIGYLLFFAVVSRLKTRTQMNAAFCVFIYLGVHQLYKGGEFLLFNNFTARVMLGFFVGCLACQFERILAKNRPLSVAFQTTFCAASTICVWASCHYGFEEFFGRYDIILPLVAYPALIIFVSVCSPVNRALSIAPLRILGECSFSLYLWHYPVQTFLRFLFAHFDISAESGWTWGIYVATVLPVAAISHFYFEMPVQKYIRKFANQRGISATQGSSLQRNNEFSR